MIRRWSESDRQKNSKWLLEKTQVIINVLTCSHYQARAIVSWKVVGTLPSVTSRSPHRYHTLILSAHWITRAPQSQLTSNNPLIHQQQHSLHQMVPQMVALVRCHLEIQRPLAAALIRGWCLECQLLQQSRQNPTPTQALPILLIQLQQLQGTIWKISQVTPTKLHQNTNIQITLQTTSTVPTLISYLLLQHPKPTPCRRTPVRWGSRIPATTHSQGPVLIRCCNHHIL